MELLVEGEVAGELVTPVRYLDYRLRLGLELLRVYLDHPDLLRPLVCKLPDRGVLREEAVPVGPPVPGANGTEEVRDGRRSKDRLGGDPVLATVEGPELSREHVHGPHEQHGIGVLLLHPYLCEVHPLL